MKTIQVERLESYRARYAWLVAAPEIAGRTALARQIAAYGEQLAVVDQLIAEQRRYLPAEHARRDAIFGEMVHAALVVAGIVESYASEHAVPGLRDQVRLVPSDFALARFDDRVTLAQQLHDAVLPFVPELSGYDLTPEVMADLQAKIRAAAHALPTLRGVIISKQVATVGLAAALQRLCQLERERILPLLFPLQKSEPGFYRRYQLFREVSHRRRTRAAGETAEMTAQLQAVETIGQTTRVDEDTKLAA